MEGSGTMANVTGFAPAVSGQEPKDEFGNTFPVGVWGDSNTDVGVFGTSGAVPPGGNIVIASMLKAGVIGHGTDRPGMIGHSETACGVCGFSEKFSAVYAYSTNPDSDPTVASIFGIASNIGIAVLGSGGAVKEWSARPAPGPEFAAAHGSVRQCSARALPVRATAPRMASSA
jgi:hypothetical protein